MPAIVILICRLLTVESIQNISIDVVSTPRFFRVFLKCTGKFLSGHIRSCFCAHDIARNVRLRTH